MMESLNEIALLSAWFQQLPRTVLLLVYGALVAYTIGAGGYALARTGVKPLWVLLVLVPTVNIVALWVWAYCRWPAQTRKS